MSNWVRIIKPSQTFTDGPQTIHKEQTDPAAMVLDRYKNRLNTRKNALQFYVLPVTVATVLFLMVQNYKDHTCQAL